MKKILFIGLFICVACRDDKLYDGDFFFLISKNAEMPVIVRGNVASGVFILFLHGGPGGTAIQKIGLPAFNALEESYATVFWDQRNSGSSQGNGSDSDLNLSQFVEDLDKLIAVIQYRYNNPQIFLMGHSWGGCLGTAYLSDATRQAKVRGWIEVDGAHNNPLADDLSLEWIRSYATQQIAVGIDVDFWRYALDWYSENPDFTSDQLEHYAFIERANGYIYDPDIPRDPVTFPEFSFSYVFDSPANVTAALTNYSHVIRHFIVSDIDLTTQMPGITLPALIVWGRHDGIIPYPMAAQAYNALGTDASRKKIITLENSAHNGFYEEPVPFAAAVKEFVETYR